MHINKIHLKTVFTSIEILSAPSDKKQQLRKWDLYTF